MGFEDDVEEASKDMGGSSDFYKLIEGDNRLRILTEPQIEVSRWGYGVCYSGAPYCTDEALEKSYQEALAKAEDKSKVQRPKLDKKWMCWAINREKKTLVILTLTWKLAKLLTDMKRSEEAGFDGWPMPYDINITAKDSGKKFNGHTVLDYGIIANRKETEVTEAEFAELAKKKKIEDIIERKKEKAKAAAAAPATQKSEEDEEDVFGADPDKIPF